MTGMSQFAALVVELAAKLGAAVPSAKAPSLQSRRRQRCSLKLDPGVKSHPVLTAVASNVQLASD